MWPRRRTPTVSPAACGPVEASDRSRKKLRSPRKQTALSSVVQSTARLHPAKGGSLATGREGLHVKRILISGLVAAATATAFTVAGGAGAAGSDVIHGGCFFDTNSQATATNGSYVGVIGDRSVTTTGDTPPALIGATVTCTITVNSAPAVSESYGDVGVAGVQAGSNQISFTAADDDVVALCTHVDFADGTSSDNCNGAI